MSDAGMNNNAMKSALKGIGLSLPKTMQQRCDPKKRIERLRSGGGKDMTEAAIMEGLNCSKLLRTKMVAGVIRTRMIKETVKNRQKCHDRNGSACLSWPLRAPRFTDIWANGAKEYRFLLTSTPPDPCN